MRKLFFATVILAFAGACASKQKQAQTNTPSAAVAAAKTKDQAADKKKHKHHHKGAAEASSGMAQAAIKCTHGKDERTIAVQDKDGGCETMYTKMGETKSIASSVHGKQHCEDVSSKIEKNLTAAGFTCQ